MRMRTKEIWKSNDESKEIWKIKDESKRGSKVLTMPGSSMSAWLRLRICMRQRGIVGREARTRCESGRAVAMRRESIGLGYRRFIRRSIRRSIRRISEVF